MDLLLHEKRFLATLIDASIVGVLALLFTIYFHPLFNISLLSLDYFFLFSFTLFMIIYQLVLLLIFKNFTFGMHLTGVKILSDSWENLNLKQIILRAISISIPILFIVNMAYVFINRNSKTIFDIISNSMVVNTGANYTVRPKK